MFDFLYLSTRYKKMNILLLGSGGREHAIAWKIAQSPKVDQLFIAPGNAGTALVGTNVNIKADDFPAIKELALANPQKSDRVKKTLRFCGGTP